MNRISAVFNSIYGKPATLVADASFDPEDDWEDDFDEDDWEDDFELSAKIKTCLDQQVGAAGA